MNSAVNIPNLIKKISRENCESSFKIIFNHFYPRLFELALYFTKNQVLAEEVVSDVFLKVWKQRKDLEKIRDLQAYLLVAVKRQSLNFLRDNKFAPLSIHNLEHHLLIESLTPENIMSNQEMVDTVRQSIQSLPEKCRLVFKMVKEEHRKYKEVAELLNISEKTVETHMGYALKKIRQDLEKSENTSSISIRKLGFLIFLALATSV